MHRKEERYPEANDPNYTYIPKPWEDGAPFPAGEVRHYLEHPSECATSCYLNNSLPVRKTKIPLESRFKAYGIHVEQALPARILAFFLVFVLLVVVGSTAWFIPFWLSGHPGDLQNATVPIVLLAAIVQLISGIGLTIFFFNYQTAYQ